MILLLILKLLTVAQDVSHEALSTASGETRHGAFVSVDEDSLRWKDANGEVPIDLTDVERVEFNEDAVAASASKPSFELYLVDGSRLVGDELVSTEDGVQISADIGELQIRRRNILGIRFYEADSITESQMAEMDAEWSEQLNVEISEDVLTLRKLEEDEDGQPVQSFSEFEGIIESIDNENVQFQFGGDSVPVKRARIAFVRFYHPAGRSLPDSSCLVKLVNGTVLEARAVEGTRDELRITTAAGVPIESSATHIQSIDFAYGRVIYLDALEPVTSEWSPFFASSVSQELLESLNRYRINQSYDGEPLSLYRPNGTGAEPFGLTNVQSFSRGIAMRSESRLIYSTAGKFERFTALAGIDPAVRPRGNIELTIRGDGEILFQATVAGTDREPVAIDVPIQGVRRLAIEVGFGEQLDIGDQLNLCRARLIK